MRSSEAPACPWGSPTKPDFPEAQTVALEPGDHVLLLTDGIIEAVGPDRTYFGTDRAIDVAQGPPAASPAGQIVEALHRAVRDFAGNGDLIDDVTSVVIKVGPGTAEREHP